jgi:hypothetical protein
MKIEKKKNISKKSIALFATTASIVLAGLSIYAYYTMDKKDNNSITRDTHDSPVVAKDNNPKTIQQSDTLPDKSQSLTTEDVPVNTAATATITRLEQKDSTVYFDATVNNATNLGKCVVSFTTPNDKPIAKEFDATKNGTEFRCSLTTSALEFSYLGKWDVTLRYYDGNSQIITKGSVTIS